LEDYSDIKIPSNTPDVLTLPCNILEHRGSSLQVWWSALLYPGPPQGYWGPKAVKVGVGWGDKVCIQHLVVLYLVSKHNVAQYYTRAVIYPLYPAGDIQAQTVNELMMSTSVQPPQPDSIASHQS